MDFKVLITQPAIEDLGGIAKYIGRDNPDSARRTGYWLIEKAESLRQLPFRGRLVPERSQGDCRELIAEEYRIVYRVKEDQKLVEVPRFWHSKRGMPVIYEPGEY